MFELTRRTKKPKPEAEFKSEAGKKRMKRAAISN